MPTQNEKDDKTTDAEECVDDSPEKWNAANRPKDNGERQDGYAGSDSVANDPGVTNWITDGHDEGNGNDEVPEGEPVVPISEEWVAIVCFLNGLTHERKPSGHRRPHRVEKGPLAIYGGEKAKSLSCEDGCEATRDEGEGEEG